MAESRFPMTLDKCPVCGCTETVTRLAWEEEAEKGRVKKDTPVAAQRLQIPLLDPKKSPLIVGGINGILLIQIDFCADCGAAYCTSVSVQDAKLQAGPAPGQQGGPSSPFSRS